MSDAVEFRTVDPECDDAVASMTAYFVELDKRFPEGFDVGDSIVADAHKYREPSGCFLVGYRDGVAVACGAASVFSDDIVEVKRMWVHPDHRGSGVGAGLLAELETAAAARGATTVYLDTNSELTEALRLYRRAGYHEIDRYNDNPYARHWFAKTL